VSVPGFDQLAFLREVLPRLGVWQGVSPDEEADDVIASLVRGSLRGQNNLIYSTDRDLLQLVSGTTQMLVPGVGGRKDAMYDQAAVERTFGVPPESIVQLRAFFGDTSDNIPGVPRVPKKVLRALVTAHKTVSGVYGSGLAGLTKSQYEKLRASEPQVTINVELMTLVNVPVSITDPNVDADVAARRLQELDIKSSPLLEPFFGRAKAADT
jgi:DNA polymerase-1